MLAAVTSANEAQKRHVAEKVVAHFGGSMAGKKVALWGLAFKPGTDDVREAPAATIAERLIEAGATVVGHDPEGEANFRIEFGDKKAMSYAKTAYDAIKGADALCLVTEWSEYRRPNWEKVKTTMRGRAIFDFRNQYSPAEVRGFGFDYVSVGRS